MKLSCSPSCMALQHPEAGFYMGRCMEGETTVIEASSTNRIIFLTYGSIVVNSKEREDYEVEEKNMILCYKEYDYHITAKSNTEYIVAYFTSLGGACDTSMLSQLFRANKNMHYEFKSMPFNEPIRDFLSTITRYLRDGIECKHLHYPSIQVLFVLLRFYYPPKALLKFFYNLIDFDSSFTALIENNVEKVHTLNDLAAICGYDISTFNVVFRRHFKDITPYAWMQQQRSISILRCLEKTDMPIHEVAANFNFSNPGHLSAFCKKFWGKTPLKIRAHARMAEQTTKGASATKRSRKRSTKDSE